MGRKGGGKQFPVNLPTFRRTATWHSLSPQFHQQHCHASTSLMPKNAASFPHGSLIWNAWNRKERSHRRTRNGDTDVHAMADRHFSDVWFQSGGRLYMFQLSRPSAPRESRSLAVLDLESTGSGGHQVLVRDNASRAARSSNACNGENGSRWREGTFRERQRGNGVGAARRHCWTTEPSSDFLIHSMTGSRQCPQEPRLIPARTCSGSLTCFVGSAAASGQEMRPK
jgi:hypothetical protein